MRDRFQKRLRAGDLEPAGGSAAAHGSGQHGRPPRVPIRRRRRRRTEGSRPRPAELAGSDAANGTARRRAPRRARTRGTRCRRSSCARSWRGRRPSRRRTQVTAATSPPTGRGSRSRTAGRLDVGDGAEQRVGTEGEAERDRQATGDHDPEHGEPRQENPAAAGLVRQQRSPHTPPPFSTEQARAGQDGEKHAPERPGSTDPRRQRRRRRKGVLLLVEGFSESAHELGHVPLDHLELGRQLVRIELVEVLFGGLGERDAERAAVLGRQGARLPVAVRRDPKLEDVEAAQLAAFGLVEQVPLAPQVGEDFPTT